MKKLILKLGSAAVLSLALVATASAEDFELTASEKNAVRALVNHEQIGEVTSVKGYVTIIHPDGSEEIAVRGSEIYEGDVVETEDNGSMNIGFNDNSNFTIDTDARIAIDEFVYDPASDANTQDFSVMRSVFMWTSRIIGRETPVLPKDQPVGSLGIRG